MNKEEMWELRLQGKTYRSIGALAGITYQRVHQILTGHRSKQKLWSQLTQEQKNRRHQSQKIWRQTQGKEAQAQRNRYTSLTVKRIVLAHYGHGNVACVKCNYNDVRALSLDHINGNGREERKRHAIPIGGTVFYRWLIKHNYPEGYQTLCMNCQWIKRFENREFGEGVKKI